MQRLMAVSCSYRPQGHWMFNKTTKTKLTTILFLKKLGGGGGGGTKIWTALALSL